jgi:hypothetical protein
MRTNYTDPVGNIVATNNRFESYLYKHNTIRITVNAWINLLEVFGVIRIA